MHVDLRKLCQCCCLEWRCLRLHGFQLLYFMYTYIPYVHIRISCMYTYVYPVCTYTYILHVHIRIVCMYTYNLYVHVYPACTPMYVYSVCTHTYNLYVHVYPVCTRMYVHIYPVCIIYNMYVHVYPVCTCTYILYVHYGYLFCTILEELVHTYVRMYVQYVKIHLYHVEPVHVCCKFTYIIEKTCTHVHMYVQYVLYCTM